MNTAIRIPQDIAIYSLRFTPIPNTPPRTWHDASENGDRREKISNQDVKSQQNSYVAAIASGRLNLTITVRAGDFAQKFQLVQNHPGSFGNRTHRVIGNVNRQTGLFSDELVNSS